MLLEWVERKRLDYSQKSPALSTTVFGSIMLFTVAAILVVTVLLSLIFYNASERMMKDGMLEEAQTAASQLEGRGSSSREGILQDEISGLSRYTLVGPDGSVLYDSAVVQESMENHAERPEIAAALKSGEAVSARRSATLDADTVYAAVRLDDGSVLRLSREHQSFLSFLSLAVIPVVVMLVALILGVLFLSRSLSRMIMHPIDELDVAHPLDNKVYAEMEPLLERIDQQRECLMEQNRELTRAESMRRDFSSNVSHDMKTPVHAISGYAEILKSGAASPEDVQRFAGVIYDEAQMLRKLIDDVLTLSRLDEAGLDIMEQRIVDMKSVANRVCERLAFIAQEAEVTVSCSLEMGPVFVCGDEQLLEEMMCNLVENAIKYNKHGGVVRVKVLSDGEWCVVRVSDTGVGIPPELQEKIFQRFYRPDKSRSKETGGTGLGLAIVKHVAMRHGGNVEVESDVSLGSTFTVRLPLLDDDSEETL